MKTLFLLLAGCYLLTAQTLSYDPENHRGELYQYAQYAEAGDREFDLNEVLRNEKLQFRPLQEPNRSLGFTAAFYWVRFSLKNSGEQTRTYYLETARPITDRARLYQVTATSRERFESGDQLPFENRQLPHRSTVFKIVLPPGSSPTYYLELKSDGETINLPLRLYDVDSFWQHTYRQQLFLGIFYGILFIAGIIYLFFYTSLKEKSFLYYGIYVFTIALFQSALDGLFFQYLFPSGGFLNDRAVLLTALICNFFLMKYCEHFLDVKHLLPKIYKGFNCIYLFIGLLVAATLASKTSMEWVYPISNVNGLFSLLLIFTAVVILIHRKIHIDPYFGVGICFLVCGLLGFVLNNLGVLPNNFVTLNSAKFGIGLEVVFLSLSMTNLIRNLRLDKERSQDMALKKSEEISELKSFFMSNMSHELRTPLNLIMGITEEQLNPYSRMDDRENYKLIRHASMSLLSTINDILDFDKIERNELRLRNEVFNPSEALKQIIEAWRTEAVKKGLKYEFKCGGDLRVKVCADKERLLQIANNLLSNAVKFTQVGRICFNLDTCIRGEADGLLKMEVSDTGPGMEEAQKKLVFDSFSQMRENNKRKFGGIGLGLSLVKRLVELFGGAITLESEVGTGTSIVVQIPVEPVFDSSTEPLENVFPNPGVPIHILVVEDNRMNQLVMRKLLSSWEYCSFEIVSNGLEAHQKLREKGFDLLLMDLQMPVMDGYEATQAIRRGVLGADVQNIPIIAVSADATDETRQRVLEIGMNDHIAKPVTAEVLYDKILRNRNVVGLAG